MQKQGNPYGESRIGRFLARVLTFLLIMALGAGAGTPVGVAVGYIFVDRGYEGGDAYGLGMFYIGALGLLIGGLIGAVFGAVIATRARLLAPAAATGDVLGAAGVLLIVRPWQRFRRQPWKNQRAQVLAVGVVLLITGFVASQSVLVSIDDSYSFIITRGEVVVRVHQGDRVAIKWPFVEQAHRLGFVPEVQLKDYQVATSTYTVNAAVVYVSFIFDTGATYFDVARDGEALFKPAVDAALDAVNHYDFVARVQAYAQWRGAEFDRALLDRPFQVSIADNVFNTDNYHGFFVEAVSDPLAEQLRESLGVNLINLRFLDATVTPH